MRNIFRSFSVSGRLIAGDFRGLQPFLLVLLAFFAGFSSLSANPFHVSPTGRDSNNGSENAPFQTIERARDAARAAAANQQKDIVIYLHEGRYEPANTLRFNERDSGRNGHKIIYRAMPGAEVRISGGKQITGWKPFRDGIYRANAPVSAFRQLYINGQRGIRARTPNNRYERLRNWSGDKTIQVPTHTVGNWSGLDQVEIVINKHWHQSRLRISEIRTSGDTATIIPQNPERDVEWRVAWPNREPNQPFYFENSLDFLDSPGEWYLDRRAQHVYYMPRAGENMETAEIIAPRLEQIIDINGASNLQFIGLIFEDTTWTLPDRDGFIPIQANLYVDPGTVWLPSGIHVENAQNIRFERNILRNMGGGAIALRAGTYKTEIIGNAIASIAASGISVYTDIHNTNPPENRKSRSDIVRNNYITRVGQDYPGGVGIVATYTDGLIVEHNELVNNPYTGISIGWGWTNTNTALRNNVVRYNRIHQVMNLLDDGAGIYTLSKQPGGIYEENYIYDLTRNPNAGSYMITALYLDEQTEGITMRNNVIRNLAGVEEFKMNQVQPGFNNVSNNGPNIANADAIIAKSGLQSGYRDLPDLVSGKPKSKPGPFNGKPVKLPGRLEAENFDHGGPGIAYHDSTPLNQGGEFRPDENVDIEKCLDTGGGHNIGYITPGEWLEYTVDVTSAGTYDLKIRAASIHSGKFFHITSNGSDISGRIDLPNTGGWQNWQTVIVQNVKLRKGEQKLRFRFDTGDFNLNWVEAVAKSTETGPTVTLTSPVDGTSFETGEKITLRAEVPSGTGIASIEFFSGNRSLGKRTSAPFTLTWEPENGGAYPLTAELLTTDGKRAVSEPVQISVVPGRGPLDGVPSKIPGTIFAVDFDPGGEGVGYHDTTPGNQGGFYRDEDVDIEVAHDSEAEFNVGWVAAGEWLQYTVEVRNSGKFNLHLRVASAESNGSFYFSFNGKRITPDIQAPNTGGWQNWSTITIPDIELPAETGSLRLHINSGEFNISRFDFESTASSGNFDDWLTTHFSPAEIANPEISGPAADPHGYGIPNLMRYALGMNPTKPDHAGLPKPGETKIGNNRYLTLTYSRPAEISDVEYLVEVSNDLRNWSSKKGETVEISSTVIGSTRHITVRDSQPITKTGSRFLRLRVNKT